MKRIIVVGDGMADAPVAELGGKTPLMVAHTPAMDQIAEYGRTGQFLTIKPEMPAGSAVANLSILGYDPDATFQGRGVLEAASLGVSLSETDMAARINLVCFENNKIRSHSAGHISNEEARQLILDLQLLFRNLNVQLVQGLSYRHVLVVPDGDARLQCAAPHDHVGEDFLNLLVQPQDIRAAPTADLLNKLIHDSHAFLRSHPINLKRQEAGHQPANALWPWSPGVRPRMRTFVELFGIRGAVITAVDVIKGLGIYAGFEVVHVDGATGLADTNYEGKADACLEALEDHDFVYVHVEAPDEAGHQRDADLKIRCIEDLDSRLLQRILEGLEKRRTEAVIALLPDHHTPVSHGRHTRDPVPVAIRDPRRTPDAVRRFDESSVISGELGFLSGTEFIESVLSDQ